MWIRCLMGMLLLAYSALAPTQRPVSRLGLVTWNPEEHTLRWTTEEGQVTDKGEWKKIGHTEYAIDFHKQLMYKNGKQPLPFTAVEAARMDTLFNKLASEYAVDSVKWYEGGGKIEEQPQPQKRPDRGTWL